MRFLQKLVVVSALVWCLGGAAFAGPRVAIVTPVAGDVWVGNDKITTPRLVEEGQKLLVGADGQARVQLLGSAKEKLIKGSAMLVIVKADLEKDSQVLSRGSLAVKEEIGTIKQSASANARRGDVEKNYVVGFALSLPPAASSDGWTAKVLSEPNSFPAKGIVVELTDLTSQSQPLSVEIDEFVTDLPFPKDLLVAGHRYELFVQGPKSGYVRQFQVLSTDERAELMETARAMRKEALDTGELAVLLRLANFYSSFDENEKLADVLLEAVNSPSFQELDEVSQNDLKDALNKTLRSLDRRNYEGG